MRFMICVGWRLLKFLAYVSTDFRMFVTFRLLMLAYSSLNASVMGCIVAGSFGSKYNSFTAWRFSSLNARGSPSKWSFPFFISSASSNHCVHGGICAPVVSATVASRIGSSPGFIKSKCLRLLEIGGWVGAILPDCLANFFSLVGGGFTIWSTRFTALLSSRSLYPWCFLSRTSS